MRFQPDCLPESGDGLLIFACLVKHQAEIRLQFRDFWVQSDRASVGLGGSFEISPGLGLLRRGQERIKVWGLLRECYA